MPPAPPRDLSATKPSRAMRLFVMGESSTAGFPFARNGTFSRILADALRDVLPDDSVEVVNLGIAATNSYQLLDLAYEVIAEQPDAVLVYAGHNEFYQAHWAWALPSIAASPTPGRFYLRAMRWRTVHCSTAPACRATTGRPARTRWGARRRQFHGRQWRPTRTSRSVRRASGPAERQFTENLGLLLRRLHAARIRVFVASLTSNVREQPPFAAPGNEGPGAARAAWEGGSAPCAPPTPAPRASHCRARVTSTWSGSGRPLRSTQSSSASRRQNTRRTCRSPRRSSALPARPARARAAA